MADLSTLSDADLLQALGQPTQPQQPQGVGALSDEQLRTALASTHPVAGPSGDLSVDIPREIGTAGASALGGLLATPRAIAGGVDWLGRRVGLDLGAESKLAGIRDPSNPNQPLFPDYPTAREMAFQTTGGTEYQPQTWLGRRAMDVATAAPMVALNPAAAPAILGGAASAGALNEQLGQTTLPWESKPFAEEHPFATWALGSIPGAWTAGRLASTPQRLAGALRGEPVPGPYQAFKDEGVRTTLSGTATGDPGLMELQKQAARMPGSEGAIATETQGTMNDWQNRFEQVRSKLGNASTADEAGASLQNAARGWVTDFKSLNGQLWDRFRAQVPSDTQIPVSNFRTTLDDVGKDFGGADALAKVLQPKLAGDLKGALATDISPQGTLPWQTVQSVRTRLGEMLEGGQPIEGMSLGNVRRLYGALSRDMDSGAASLSPQAANAYQQASQYTRVGHQFLDDHLNSILNADTPAQATTAALSGSNKGGARIQALRANLPGATGDLAAYKLADMATNNTSPSNFATAYQGRRPALSPEASAALFPDAATQKSLGNMADIGDAMRPMEKDLASSPTATHQMRLMGRVMLAGELAKEGHELAGTPGAIAGGAAGFFAPDIMGRAAQTVALNPYVSALYGRLPAPPETALTRGQRLALATVLGPRRQLLPATPSVPSVPATPATTSPQ